MDHVDSHVKISRQALLRALVSLALLVFVLYQADLSRIGAAVARIDPLSALVAFALVYLAVAVSTYKWGLVLKARSLDVGFRGLFAYYLMGLFFNNFLPTAIGGDVVRGYEMARQDVDVSEAATSILADRLIAGASLGIAALVGLAFVARTPRLVALVVLFAMVSAGAILLALQPRAIDGLVRRTARGRFSRAGAWAERTASALRATLRDTPLVLRVAVWSLVFQAILALINVCIFTSLGRPVDFGHAMVYVPIISALTVLPISLSGLGVREASYVYFFSALGIDAASAIAASLLFFAAVAIASLPGAVLFIVGRRGARAVSEGGDPQCCTE